MNVSRDMLAVCTGLLSLLAGCSNQAFSPPAGWVPVEEPVPLADGKRTIGGGIGFGTVGLDAADFTGANLRYRQGIARTLEIQAEAAAVVFTEETDENPAILSARVGLKGGFAADFPHLGWVAGLGFGGSAGGAFTAADIGLQLGYVNPYLTPWIALGGVASVPITSNEVDLKRIDDETSHFDHPVSTFGLRIGIGLTAHLGDSEARLHLGLANLRMLDIHGEHDSVMGFTIGFDAPL